MILPIYAGLERLPDSLLEASSDLGAPAGRTFRSVVLPLLLPAIVAGSIFTFSLCLGDYIAVKIVGGKTQLFGNVVYDNVGTANNLPFAAARRHLPRRDHGRLPGRGPPYRRPGEPVRCPVILSRRARILLRLAVGVGPRRSSTCRCSWSWSTRFNTSRTFAWPPPGFTLEWWGRTAVSEGVPRGAVDQRQGRPRAPPRSRWCSARWRPSRSSATGSSAGTRCRSW